MTWGIFKKFKDGLKKAKNWLSTHIPTIQNYVKQSRPLINTIIDETKPKLKGKVNDYLDLTDSGLTALNSSLKSNNYDDIKDWTKTNLTPRLKSGFR